MVKKHSLKIPPVVAGAFAFGLVFYCGIYGFTYMIAALFCVLLFCAFFYVIKQKKSALFCFVCLILSFFALARFFKNSSPLQTLIPDTQIILFSGTLIESPVKTANGNYRVRLKTEKAFSKNMSASCTGTIQLLLNANFVEAYYPAKLYSGAVKNGFVPFIENGVFVTVRVKPLSFSLFSVEKIEKAEWKSRIAFFRAHARLQLKRVLYEWGSAGGLLLALLSGSREYLDQALSYGFKNAGLAHILALSGMHLSLFGSLAAFFTRFFLGKRFAGCAALFCMCLFVWFAGASPSLLRALFCALLMASAAKLNLPQSILRTLSFCFILQIVFFPSHALDLAFMLSYASLFGIITIGSVLEKKLTLPVFLRSPFSASLGAQICTAPICLRVFRSLMPIGIPSSIIVSPIVSLFLILGIVLLLVCLIFPFLIVPARFFIGILYETLQFFVLIFAKVPPLRFS